MEQLKQYDTQATEADTEVQVRSPSIPPTEVQSDESPTQVITRSVSRSNSPITPPVRAPPPVRVCVPDVDVENLRPRRVGRQLPDGPPPKSTKGWTFSEIEAAIERCGLRGEWRQGGQQSRSIYVGYEFIINIQSKRTAGMQWWQSMTVWVQGLRANEISTRLCAARKA